MRDGLGAPWLALRDAFSELGVFLTADTAVDLGDTGFELHLNARKKINDCQSYAILLESSLIYPLNASAKLLRQYAKIFTWDSGFEGSSRHVPIVISHELGSGAVDGYSERPLLLNMIAANKSMAAFCPHRDLYLRRIAAIKWFHKNAPHEFRLYGSGWDKVPLLPTRVGRVASRIASAFYRKPPFASIWGGPIESKAYVLRKSRFSLVYENVYGHRGYITEKIFDAFNAGCVPIYLGSVDVQSYIPSSCFIDARTFPSFSDLYLYIKCMPESEYLRFQASIVSFLSSDSARVFSPESFARKISNTILDAQLAFISAAR
jgi:hypothetical protein